MTLKRLLKSKFILLLALLGLFPPVYFTIFTAGGIIFSAIKFASAILILIIYCKDIVKHMSKMFNVLLVVLALELLFSTLINKDASIQLWAAQIGTVIIQCFFIEALLVHVPGNGIRCFYWYFSLMTLVNTATIFFFPNAMFPNNRGAWVCWFLGEDNTAYFYYIVASTFALLYCNCIVKRVTMLAILVWASAFVFVFHNDIATGIVCQFLWGLLVIGYQFRLFKKMLKARYALYIMLAGFIILVVMRRMILAPLVAALGKDITLSGRTVIWDRTTRLIMRRPVFGYGLCDGNIYANMIRIKGILMAHDWLLNLGFAGGIAAIVIHIAQLVCAFREGKTFSATAYYRCVVIGMIIIFVRAVTEGSNWVGYLMFPAMISYSKEFQGGINTKATVKNWTIKFTFGKLVRRSRLT